MADSGAIRKPSVGTLTRADLADIVHREIGLSRAESAGIVEGILHHMCAGLADGQNVKISGFGMLLPGWTRQDVKPLITELIDLFGPSRLMFASNFPVDKLFRSFRDIYTDYAECVRWLSPSEQEEMFSGTAMQLYRPVFPSVIRK